MNTDTANAAEIDLRDRDAVAAVLRTVPRRFVVGFAARCARRVQPELLVRLPWDDGFVLHHLADSLLAIAEAYAKGLIQRVRQQCLIKDWRTQMNGSTATHAAYFAAEAAHATAHAAALVAKAAHATSEAAAHAAFITARVCVVPASTTHDFSTLRELSRNNPDDFLDDRPVPEGFFGALWVDGMPEEYKVALAKLYPEPAPDNSLADLDDEGKAALEDERWVSRQYNLGAFDAFGGEHIAVVGKKVLGHDPDLLKLREDVTRETGYPASRIVTTLILRRRKPSVTPAPAPTTAS